MDTFPSGTESVFARAIAAEVRSRLAALRVNQRDFATDAGFSSHNYSSTRLRDEKPFTVDDVEKIARYFDEDADAFVNAAVQNHGERIWGELLDLGRKAVTELKPKGASSAPTKHAARKRPTRPKMGDD